MTSWIDFGNKNKYALKAQMGLEIPKSRKTFISLEEQSFMWCVSQSGSIKLIIKNKNTNRGILFIATFQAASPQLNEIKTSLKIKGPKLWKRPLTEAAVGTVLKKNVFLEI